MKKNINFKANAQSKAISAEKAWERYMNREICSILAHMVLGIVFWFHMQWFQTIEGSFSATLAALAAGAGTMWFRMRWDYIAKGFIKHFALIAMALPLFMAVLFGWDTTNTHLHLFYLVGTMSHFVAGIMLKEVSVEDIGFRWLFKQTETRKALQIAASAERKAKKSA